MVYRVSAQISDFWASTGPKWEQIVLGLCGHHFGNFSRTPIVHLRPKRLLRMTQT